jgi:hypothetical protein
MKENQLIMTCGRLEPSDHESRAPIHTTKRVSHVLILIVLTRCNGQRPISLNPTPRWLAASRGTCENEHRGRHLSVDEGARERWPWRFAVRWCLTRSGEKSNKLRSLNPLETCITRSTRPGELLRTSDEGFTTRYVSNDGGGSVLLSILLGSLIYDASSSQACLDMAMGSGVPSELRYIGTMGVWATWSRHREREHDIILLELPADSAGKTIILTHETHTPVATDERVYGMRLPCRVHASAPQPTPGSRSHTSALESGFGWRRGREKGKTWAG